MHGFFGFRGHGKTILRSLIREYVLFAVGKENGKQPQGLPVRVLFLPHDNKKLLQFLIGLSELSLLRTAVSGSETMPWLLCSFRGFNHPNVSPAGCRWLQVC